MEEDPRQFITDDDILKRARDILATWQEVNPTSSYVLNVIKSINTNLAQIEEVLNTSYLPVVDNRN